MAVATISATELQAKIDAGEKLHILDVREPMERSELHLADTAFIPLGQLPGRFQELELERDATVYVYCRSGARSASACSFLEQEGYNAINVSGGIMDWQNVPGAKLARG